jgi:hypothetical protein
VSPIAGTLYLVRGTEAGESPEACESRPEGILQPQAKPEAA